jgi:hypothetical protein
MHSTPQRGLIRFRQPAPNHDVDVVLFQESTYGDNERNFIQGMVASKANFSGFFHVWSPRGLEKLVVHDGKGKA